MQSFGTEGRRKDGAQLPGLDQIYEFVVFRGASIALATLEREQLYMQIAAAQPAMLLLLPISILSASLTQVPAPSSSFFVSTASSFR